MNYFLAFLLAVSANAKFSQLDSGWNISQLEPCQKDILIGVDHLKEQKVLPLKQKVLELANSRYGTLTDYDRYFISNNVSLLPVFLRNSAISFELAYLACGLDYKDHNPINSIVHVGLTLSAIEHFGYQKACEWTTGHEMDLNKPIITNVERRPFQSPAKKGPYRVWSRDDVSGPINRFNFDGYPGLAKGNQMDLANNQVGLKIYREHPRLSKECVQLLALRVEATEKGGHALNNEDAIKKKLAQYPLPPKVPVKPEGQYLMRDLNESARTHLADSLQRTTASLTSCQQLIDKILGPDYNMIYFEGDPKSCDPGHTDLNVGTPIQGVEVETEVNNGNFR